MVLERLSATDEPEEEDPEPPAEETYTPDTTNAESKTYTLTWADNNSNERPGANELKAALSLTFSIDGAKPVVLTAETAQAYFGITAEEFAEMFDVVDPSLGTTKVTTAPLFTSVTDRSGKTYAITWNLACSLEGYHAAKTEGGFVLQVLNKYTFKVEAKTGEEGFDTLFAEGGPLYNLAFGCTQEGVGEWPVSGLSDKMNEHGWSVIWSTGEAGDNTGTYTLTAPAYDAGGNPIEYFLTDGTNPPEIAIEEGYEFSYDNAESANHGSDTSAAYPGGTLTVTRVDTTTLDATKMWLDGGNRQLESGEEEITFTLWRYSSNGQTAANASQVTDESGNFVTIMGKISEVTGQDGVID